MSNKQTLVVLGTTLKNIREAKGISYYELHRQGFTKATVKRIEAGEGYSIQKLIDYLAFLELAISISVTT